MCRHLASCNRGADENNRERGVKLCAFSVVFYSGNLSKFLWREASELMAIAVFSIYALCCGVNTLAISSYLLAAKHLSIMAVAFMKYSIFGRAPSMSYICAHVVGVQRM